MKVFAALFITVAMLTLPTKGYEDEPDHHVIMHGPHGEVVYDDDPYFFMEDDYGVPQKVYAVLPNVSYAIPPLMLRSQVRFHLFTKGGYNQPTEERLFVGEEHNLRSSKFNANLPVKILIHGFGNSIKSETIQNPMKAYLETGNYNVIGVDWGDNCPFPYYLAAKGNTIQVGRYVAELLAYLIERAGVQPENIHIIGHSLGAHVSGIAGFNLGHHRAGRITGLDPAGPFYFDTPHQEMLDATDAEFVDAIHTCGGYGLPQLGFMGPIANADFYPNGGQNLQPGCEAEYFWNKHACSHSKAHHLWTESIRDKYKFPVHRCNSLSDASNQQCGGSANGVMGDAADSSMTGLYWLKTA